jgi:hypothetical protein
MISRRGLAKRLARCALARAPEPGLQKDQLDPKPQGLTLFARSVNWFLFEFHNCRSRPIVSP